MDKRYVFWIEFEESQLPVNEVKLEFHVKDVKSATDLMFQYVSEQFRPLVIKRYSTFTYSL